MICAERLFCEIVPSLVPKHKVIGITMAVISVFTLPTFKHVISVFHHAPKGLGGKVVGDSGSFDFTTTVLEEVLVFSWKRLNISVPVDQRSAVCFCLIGCRPHSSTHA